MLKLGYRMFETFSVSGVNLKKLFPNVYPCALKFNRCPLCGSTLIENYVYAIQISEDECVKTHGNACRKCEAFFSTQRYLLNKLEGRKTKDNIYILKHDYDISYDSVRYSEIYKKVDSVYMQITVYFREEKDLRTYTIVCEQKDEDKKRNIICLDNPVAVSLLLAAENDERCVELNGKKFQVLKVKKKHFADSLKFKEMSKKVKEVLLLNGPLPELTSERTLFVYKGTISCHKHHHLEDYRARIESIDDKQIGFFVEYCRECDKFLMQYENYAGYLNRYKLFPMKTQMLDYRDYDDSYYFDRADYSPLSLSGYRVDENHGYSKEMRQKILSFIIDYKILSKQQVCNYLELFINTNGKAVNNKRALMKWQEDKEFVLNYRLKEHPVVKIGKLERK